MTAKKKECGVGALVWVYKKYLKPSKLINDAYPNATDRCKVNDLLVVGREVRKCNKKDQLCVLFRHDNFPNEILYCAKRWAAHVISEGEPQHYFDIDATTIGDEAPAAIDENGEAQEGGDAIPEHVYHLGTAAEDIAHMRGMGFEVDDDNDPAQRIYPMLKKSSLTTNKPGVEWDLLPRSSEQHEGPANTQSWHSRNPFSSLQPSNRQTILYPFPNEVFGRSHSRKYK